MEKQLKKLLIQGKVVEIQPGRPTERGLRFFKIPVEGGRAEQLTDTGRNSSADWFDPRTLPVQPNIELLTTMWGKLKQK